MKLPKGSLGRVMLPCLYSRFNWILESVGFSQRAKAQNHGDTREDTSHQEILKVVVLCILIIHRMASNTGYIWSLILWVYHDDIMGYYDIFFFWRVGWYHGLINMSWVNHKRNLGIHISRLCHNHFGSMKIIQTWLYHAPSNTMAHVLNH